MRFDNLFGELIKRGFPVMIYINCWSIKLYNRCMIKKFRRALTSICPPFGAAHPNFWEIGWRWRHWNPVVGYPTCRHTSTYGGNLAPPTWQKWHEVSVVLTFEVASNFSKFRKPFGKICLWRVIALKVAFKLACQSFCTVTVVTDGLGLLRARISATTGEI